MSITSRAVTANPWATWQLAGHLLGCPVPDGRVGPLWCRLPLVSTGPVHGPPAAPDPGPLAPAAGTNLSDVTILTTGIRGIEAVAVPYPVDPTPVTGNTDTVTTTVIDAPGTLPLLQGGEVGVPSRTPTGPVVHA